MSACHTNERLVDAYRRERLSFLQYVRQATPYADRVDRPTLERVRELADAESTALDGFAEYLDRHRVTVPHIGTFPTVFTNFNFIAIRKLLPELIADEARGLAALELDAGQVSAGEGRTRLETLVEAKRMHLREFEKLLDRNGATVQP